VAEGGSTLNSSFLGEQPTFDRFTNICADIIYCFALGDASRQRWHFRPVSTFFRSMNEHFQCHKWMLTHQPIARKTDLYLLAASPLSTTRRAEASAKADFLILPFSLLLALSALLPF
jgi:hypothetical protein